MRTTLAFGLAMVTVVCPGSLALAQPNPAPAPTSTASTLPVPPASSESRDPAASQGAQLESQPKSLAAGEVTAAPATAATSQPAQIPAREPPARTVSPEGQPTKDSKDSKDSKGEPPFGTPEPCLSPDSEDGTNLSTNCSGVIGLRAAITRTRGVGPDDAVGLTLSTEGEEYVRRGIWTARTLHRLAIGGGTAGFEGVLQGGWAGGVRVPVAPSGRHGPVLRLGMVGYLRGNDAYYGSLLELPQLQLGYQYMHGKTVVELGATAGAVLVGRSRTGDSERRLLGSGFERGGYLAVQFPWFRFGVSGSRLPVNDDLSEPLDVLEGSLCARIHGFALCSDARATRTDAVIEAGEPVSKVRSLYAGFTVGVTRE